MNWDMPYGIMKPSMPISSNHISPLSDIVVATPSSTYEAPSPTAVAVREMTGVQRARLFVQGRHHDLLKSIGKQQRRSVPTPVYIRALSISY